MQGFYLRVTSLWGSRPATSSARTNLRMLWHGLLKLALLTVMYVQLSTGGERATSIHYPRHEREKMPKRQLPECHHVEDSSMEIIASFATAGRYRLAADVASGWR